MEELYERIEDYLDGQLEEAERTAFEAALQSDPQVSAAFDIVREARERLSRQWAEEKADTELVATLRQLGQHHFQAETAATAPAASRPWIVRHWPKLAAAATFAGILIWLGWPAGDPDARLYAQYREYPEAAFVVRSEAPDGSEMAQATSAFNSGHYDVALPILERKVQTAPNESEARLFLAICLIETGRSADARIHLAELVKGGGAWASDAGWYTALSYLKEKNRALCIETLRNIPPGDPHYASAQALLKKLQ
ncbi:MAG: tetratricopeptide repeat protein [Saprospiraceae bacterium]